jgi:predicted oxidoreductase
MVVNSHHAESCPFRGKDHADALASGLEAIEGAAEERESRVVGAWVNGAGHTAFFLVDAPHAHRIDEIIQAAGLTGRTHSQVFAVVELPTILERINTVR